MIDLKEREAIVTIALMAAFADGQKHDDERAHLKTIFESLEADAAPDLYTRVLLDQASLDDEAGKLTEPAHRTLAYEMAVSVCDADGHANAAEQAFLERLRTALGLDAETAHRVDHEAETLAETPLDAADPAANGSLLPVPVPAATLEAAPTEANGGDPAAGADPEVNAMILKYAVLNGGLELLPQSLATMAIVPMQMKMVYRIGLRHGFELDRGHIKELLATVGLGMTSQVVETHARKLLGGFMKKATKKTLGKKGKKKGKHLARAAGVATGAAMSFAATYAIGQVAHVYYGGGRQLATPDLRALFDRNLEQGRALYANHRGAIEESARTTDLSSLLAMVRTP